jgi:hypothetical protein
MRGRLFGSRRLRQMEAGGAFTQENGEMFHPAHVTWRVVDLY